MWRRIQVACSGTLGRAWAPAADQFEMLLVVGEARASLKP